MHRATTLDCELAHGQSRLATQPIQRVGSIEINLKTLRKWVRKCLLFKQNTKEGGIQKYILVCWNKILHFQS